MNLIELERSLRQLRLGGIAAVLETRLHQAQAEAMAPIDLISCLVTDELTRRSERLLERRRKQAAFRDPNKTLDNFDFTFNPKMNRSLVFDLATCAFIGKREDALFLGPGGTGKSHNASSRLPMKAHVARSKTRLRFIFGLKVKSKLSSVLWGSRNAACLRRRSSNRSLRRLNSSATRHEIRSIGAMASAWAWCSRVSSTAAMPPSRSCRNARSNSMRFTVHSPWFCFR